MRFILNMAALGLLTACWAEAPANGKVQICEAMWLDASRANREVPIRIRLPARGSQLPVILFSHGLGGSLEGGRAWVDHWSKAGFAVVNLQHRGSDRSIIGTGGLLGAMNRGQLEARAKDVSFVLDTLASRSREGSCDLGRLDLSRIGMSGHSFGAHTAQAIAGQRLHGINVVDPRIDAVIAFSPAPPPQGSVGQAFAQVRIPFFSITGSEDKVAFLPRLTPAERERPFRAMPPGGKYLLVLNGADHMDMGGPDGDGRNRLIARHRDHSPEAVARRREAAEVVKRTTTEFWRWTLLGDASAKKRLDATSSHLSQGDRFERR